MVPLSEGLALDREPGQRAIGHVHGGQQGPQLTAFPGGHRGPGRTEAGDQQVDEFPPLTGPGHRPHAVEIFRPDPAAEQVRQGLRALDDLGLVHGCPPLGFLTTPGPPSSGHAAQIPPPGFTMTVTPTASRSPWSRHRWFGCQTGRVSG
jgi:hypothetical protein